LRRPAPRPRAAPRVSAPRLRIRLLGSSCVLLLLACAGAEHPPGTVLAPVHRLVDAGLPPGDPISLSLPVATVHDDTRYVLRAPVAASVIFGRKLEDRSGNRLLRQRQILPEELSDAEALLVLPTVRVGATWFEQLPQVLETRREGRHASVALEFPIPANPEGRVVQIAARGVAVDAAPLEHLETQALAIPEDAILEFSVGVLEPSWGFDPVEFTVDACEDSRCERIFTGSFDPTGPGGGKWSQYRVSLGALAGSTRSFHFDARRLAQQAPFSLPLWANPTVYAAQPRDPEERNVILLSVDTLRADHLGSYGYAHDTAPFIEQRFAREGTVFDTLVAAATITTPSHATMFTSLNPAAHGTVDGMRVLPKNLPTLAEWIRSRGQDTAAITENGWLSIRHGFGRGFNSFVENRSANIMDPEGQVDRTFAQAREWLERNRNKRFFLFLHTFQVHTPYAPPPRYARLFAEHAGESIDTSSPSHLLWQAEYDREIRYVDDELRRLFESIDDLGLGDDTVFILTSDHGEAFLEHGRLEHGSRLDEEVLRVPLLLWGSGVPSGQRVDAIAAHLDLMPTILDLMRLPAPRSVQGWSLVPLLAGDGVARFGSRPVFSESRGTVALGPDRETLPFFPPAFLVRVGDRKLARYHTADGSYRYEYYDLSEDPGEQSDLYARRPEAASDLFELLESYEASNRELRASIDHGAAPQSQAVELDPRQEEKLRALGYLR